MPETTEFVTHVHHLRAEGRRLAEAALTGTGQEAVPGCPGWDLDDLVRHTGSVHHWARTALEAAGDPPPRDFFATTEQSAPTGHADLVAWYADAHSRLLETLESLDPTARCWTFLPDPPGAAFWARRQAHETTIHRFDAEGAVGRLTGVETALAHDGIDEVLGFIAARGRRLVSESPVTLGVHAVDTGGRWAMRIGPEDRVVLDPAAMQDTAADATLSGLAADLYLALWNRLDDLEPTGERSVIDLWRDRARIT